MAGPVERMWAGWYADNVAEAESAFAAGLNAEVAREDACSPVPGGDPGLQLSGASAADMAALGMDAPLPEEHATLLRRVVE